jgi:hypothetical protein
MNFKKYFLAVLCANCILVGAQEQELAQFDVVIHVVNAIAHE